MSNQKIACISGIGMDAKTLTHFLLKKDYIVIIAHRRNTTLDIDNNVLPLFSKDLKNHPTARLEFTIMDQSDQSSVRLAMETILREYGKIDEFYHLGAASHVGDSFNSALSQIHTNGLSTFYILDFLKNYSKDTKFYFACSSEVFGGDPTRVPFNEKSLLEARSPYAISKIMGYNWTYFYRQTYNLYACSGFLFNHSNEYRHPSFFIKRVTTSAAKIALGKLDKLKLGNVNHWRDESFSDFMVEIMWKMLNNSNGPKDYVVGNGNCRHGEEYLHHAFNYFQLDFKKYVEIDSTRFRPNDVQKLTAEPSNAIKDLGWIPNRIGFVDHINLMCDWDYKIELGESPQKVDVFDIYPARKV